MATAATAAKVKLDVTCVGSDCLVLTQPPPSGAQADYEALFTLVFKRVEDLEEEFRRLRVDRPDDWNEPKGGGDDGGEGEGEGGFSLPKMPWDNKA